MPCKGKQEEPVAYRYANPLMLDSKEKVDAVNEYEESIASGKTWKLGDHCPYVFSTGPWD